MDLGLLRNNRSWTTSIMDLLLLLLPYLPLFFYMNIIMLLVMYICPLL